jgi:hypothetical protein
MSVDPLTKSFPMLTPYQYASNTPIAAIDLDGLEGRVETTWWDPGLQAARKNKVVTEADIDEHYRKPLQLMGTAAVGGIIIGLTYGYATPFVEGMLLRGLYIASNPANQVLMAEGGAFAAAMIDPNPHSQYSTGLGDEAGNVIGQAFRQVVKNSQESKLILGKSHVIGKYTDDIENAYHMFRDGFGLGIPKIIPPSSQIMSAMYKTIDEGGKIIMDLKDVSVEAAKKGFKSFDEAAEVSIDGFSKITEWELSKILRDADLFKNTLFKVGDEVLDGAGAGLKLIDE